MSCAAVSGRGRGMSSGLSWPVSVKVMARSAPLVFVSVCWPTSVCESGTQYSVLTVSPGSGVAATRM